MAKWAHNDVLDAPWDLIKTNCTTQLLCAGQPTDRADALSKALADVSMSSTDFSMADGDVSGRKMLVAAKNTVTVDTSGTMDHCALIDGTRLLYVTTVTEQVLTAGNTVNIPQWRAEFKDPE
jgi:hypothetical protein